MTPSVQVVTFTGWSLGGGGGLGCVAPGLHWADRFAITGITPGAFHVTPRGG